MIKRLINFILLGLSLTAFQSSFAISIQKFDVVYHHFSNNNASPTGLIFYDSKRGIELFKQARYKDDFWSLDRYFVTQKNLSFCGIASLAMVFNAINIIPPVSKTYYPYRFFTQDDLVKGLHDPKLSYQKISKNGLTLEELVDIAKRYHAVHVEYHHAEGDKGCFIQFKSKAIHAIQSGKEFIIVNFNRKLIGEIGSGHFSPLGAYDSESKRFLLLDVSRYKYPPAWVNEKKLWASMLSIDTNSHKTRGYLILKKAKKDS